MSSNKMTMLIIRPRSHPLPPFAQSHYPRRLLASWPQLAPANDAVSTGRYGLTPAAIGGARPARGWSRTKDVLAGGTPVFSQSTRRTRWSAKRYPPQGKQSHSPPVHKSPKKQKLSTSAASNFGRFSVPHWLRWTPGYVLVGSHTLF